MSYVLAALGIALLVILHEAGHFAVAKAVGMRVERFSLFFGPMLVKFRRGETEYGIGPIPLGGYVRITGMNPHEEIPPEVVSRAYYNQPVWKRIVVILAGPGVNLVIAFGLMLAIIWSSGIVKTSHGQPVYSNQVAAAGLQAPAADYLRPGDRIVAVDGRRNLNVDQITKQIASHKCAGKQVAGCQGATPVKLLVERPPARAKTSTPHATQPEQLSFSIYPRYDPSVGRMRIGFSFGAVIESMNPISAAGQSVSQMWTVTSGTVSTIARIFEPKVRSQLHGIVGGFTVTQERFAFDTTDALYTLALISLSLGVINLFPFLPLDGGHVFWALAEKVRGKRIPFEVMERAGAVGFVLIMVVFVIGLSNDISTLAGPGFSVR